MSDGDEILEAVDDLLTRIVEQQSVEAVMESAIAECERRRPGPVWDELRVLPYTDDLQRTAEWWHRLLATEPPPVEVNGYWFGIYYPCSDETMSDVGAAFYVAGSRSWPDEAWECETYWWPEGRYPESPIMLDLYRRTERTGDDAVAYFGDYFLTLAYTGATVVNLLSSTPAGKLLGSAPERAVAFGHDSGDSHEIGRISPSGLVWRVVDEGTD